MRKQKRTVIVIDGGGRGSALVEAYSKSKQVDQIVAIPGNDLMQVNSQKPVITYPQFETTSVKEILKICKKYNPILVDVPQENAIETGLVDLLEENNIPVIGPSKNAGQIEWDKAWSREFMTKYKLPQPIYKICYSEKDGVKYINSKSDRKWFVKAFGLLGGKGVLPAENNDHAKQRIKELKKFGNTGKIYLLEAALVGEEFSAFALCDGENFIYLGEAQDHKRMFNFDQGENTGGIGAVSPILLITLPVQKQINKIFKTTLDGLKKESRPYKGILYLGGILVKNKVYIIEFNSRWGDPETEVLVPKIKNDFLKLNQAARNNKIKNFNVTFDKKVRVVVTGSLNPYQDKKKERQVFGLEKVMKLKNVKLYGTRVKKKGNKYFAMSGRLFHIMGEGNNIIEARQNAYSAMSLISIEGNNLHYRTDIGWRDVERKNKNLAV